MSLSTEPPQKEGWGSRKLQKGKKNACIFKKKKKKGKEEESRSQEITELKTG